LSRKLERIRDVAIEGNPALALTELETILAADPGDVEALRLKGNILEMRALNRAQYTADKLLRSRDYVAARACYESILAIDKDNTLALIDMGDHFRNLGALEQALGYYEQAIDRLSKGRCSWSRREEMVEAFGQAIELYRQLGKESDVVRLMTQRRRLVHRMRSRRNRDLSRRSSAERGRH